MALLRRRGHPAARIGNPSRVRDPARNALLSSGARLRSGYEGAQQQELTKQAWQRKPWYYYDHVGAIKQAAQFYSRMLAPLELFAAELVVNQKTGLPEIVPTQNAKAIETLARIQDPGGGDSGRTNLLASYGRLMFLVGDSQLFVSAGESGEEQWEMLSSDELRKTDQGYERYAAPSLSSALYTEPADDDYSPISDKTAIAYRLWKHHPRYSQLADAPMQAVLDTAEEILMLTLAVRSRIRSRLASAGILLFDSAISPEPEVPEGDPAANQEDPDQDPFLVELTEHMTQPIQDEGSASAVVPLTLRVSVPEGKNLSEMLHHLRFADREQIYPEIGMREDAIKRLAIELDMPVEALLGYQDSNHWSAWMVDDDTWKIHGKPIADGLVGDLSSAFYRPTLKDLKVPGWERFLIAYDPSAVVTNPNKGKDAKDIHDRGALSDMALRGATGFDEADAPSEEERRVWISIKSRDTELAITGVPGSAGAAEDEADGTVDPGSAPEEAPDAPPEPAVASANGHLSRHAVSQRALGVCDLALLRARAAAGSRLRSLAKRDPEALASLARVENGQVASVLGHDKVVALGAPADRDLVAADRPLILEALRGFGIGEGDVRARIADGIERHAASTLYEDQPRPFPPQFCNYLDGLLLTPA